MKIKKDTRDALGAAGIFFCGEKRRNYGEKRGSFWEVLGKLMAHFWGAWWGVNFTEGGKW